VAEQLSRQNKSSQKNQSQKPPGHPILDMRPFLFTMITIFVYYSLLQTNQNQIEELSYSRFKTMVAEDHIESVTIRGFQITGLTKSKDGSGKTKQIQTTLPEFNDPALLPLLERHNTAVQIKSSEPPMWLTVLMNILPWLLIFGFFAYSNRALQSRLGNGSGGLFGFGKSKAKRYEKLEVHISFNEVAGLESAKEDLREVIEYLKNPDKFRKLGAKLPKGILLMGPPGTGKTLLAKATAAEANVPFFSISGSEFVEMFVGVGASRVRSMFEEARKLAPALIFIDEIDSVGRVRGTGMGGGNDEREQTLNQILAEMDGFTSTEPVIILAATNRPDVLDPALLRPGRFDRKVTLDLPQKKARLAILEVHAKTKPVDKTVVLNDYAARTIGFSGADLENLVNEAALHAARANKQYIDCEDFEYAHDKIILGAVGQEIINKQDRHRVAVHESGHALTALLLPNADPVAKVSIIPRGRALGVTETQPKEDRLNFSEDYLEDKISVLLGGRCAEIISLGGISTGAADDLKQATRLARSMVSQWGMSKTLGAVSYPQHEEHPFLGMELTQAKDYSDATARIIDEEVETLIKRKETETLALLTSNQDKLEKLANAVQEKETINANEIEDLLHLN
jgi:cell division protease FtsH